MAQQNANDLDVLDPQPITKEIGRSGEKIKIKIPELVLRQYNQLFKVFGRILTNVISEGKIDISDMETAKDWRGWLPQVIMDAGDDLQEILRIALEVDDKTAEQITMQQLPEVLAAIIEVNGLEQILMGFRKLSATVLAEMAKHRPAPVPVAPPASP